MTGPAKNREAAQRVDIIQVFRGLAALLVMFGHVAIATDFRFPLGVSAFGKYPDLGVDIFFVISGFVVPWSLWSQRYEIRMFPRYLARRLVRLDPPYFVMVAVGVGLAVYRSRAAGTPMPFDGTTIALHLGYLAGLAGRPWIVTVFWTLGIEFQFYILMGLVFPLFAKIPVWLSAVTVNDTRTAGVTARLPDMRAARLWMLVSIGAAVVLAVMFANRAFESVFVFHFAYFLLGILVFAVRTQGLHWGVLALYALAMAAVGRVLPMEWAVVSVFAVLTLTLPDRLPWLTTTPYGAIAAGLGNLSYSLYLTHPVLVGVVTSRAIRNGWITGPATAVAVFAAEAVICLAVAIVFYFAVERPAVHLSHRIRLRAR